MRDFLHQITILECSRLAFVGVANEISWFVGFTIEETPLHAGREPGTAAAAQSRLLYLFHHGVRCHRLQCFLNRSISAFLTINIKRVYAWHFNVFQKELSSHSLVISYPLAVISYPLIVLHSTIN